MVILPLTELEGLRETLYLLGTEANAAHLWASIAAFERGETVEFELPDPEDGYR